MHGAHQAHGAPGARQTGPPRDSKLTPNATGPQGMQLQQSSRGLARVAPPGLLSAMLRQREQKVMSKVEAVQSGPTATSLAWDACWTDRSEER